MTRTLILNQQTHTVTSRETPSAADRIQVQNAQKWQTEKRAREFQKNFLRLDARAQNVAWEQVKVKYC